MPAPSTWSLDAFLVQLAGDLRHPMSRPMQLSNPLHALGADLAGAPDATSTPERSAIALHGSGLSMRYTARDPL